MCQVRSGDPAAVAAMRSASASLGRPAAAADIATLLAGVVSAQSAARPGVRPGAQSAARGRDHSSAGTAGG